MPEIQSAQEEIRVADKKLPELGWRQGALGIGVLLLVVSLFIGAGAKGALGLLPVYVACAGALLLVVAIVAGIVAWMSSKSSVRDNTPA